MYTVSKAPSKIVTKTRRGLSQNYPKLDSYKAKIRNDNETDLMEQTNLPRPIFQTTKRNGYLTKSSDNLTLTPHHEEMIKYINESWNIIFAVNPYDSPNNCYKDCNIAINLVHNPSAYNLSYIKTKSDTNYIYCIEPPSPLLNDFKPFDLESWWGGRLFNNITKSL